MKTRPEAGWRMLATHPLASLVEGAVRAHHERPDGRGYPFGLKAGEIPVEAEIVGLCDTFDAMTSARPYRRGMPVEKALSIITEGLGSQFPVELGKTFVTLGRAGKWEHIVGHSDDGIPLGDCTNCGPTLTLRREQKAGARIYCANCAGEYEARWDSVGLAVQATGRMGAAEDLTPVADIALIHRLALKLRPALSSIPTARGQAPLAKLRWAEALKRRLTENLRTYGYRIDGSCAIAVHRAAGRATNDISAEIIAAADVTSSIDVPKGDTSGAKF